MSRFFDFLVRWGETTFESSRETYIQKFNLEGLQIEERTHPVSNKTNKKMD
jgi:hypothetical protein